MPYRHRIVVVLTLMGLGLVQRQPGLFDQGSQHDFFMGIDPALQLLCLHAAHPLQVFRPGLQLGRLLPQSGFTHAQPCQCGWLRTV